MKGSNEGKGADRCERSRSRDVARPRGEGHLPQTRQEEVQRDRRERSRSRDVVHDGRIILGPQTRPLRRGVQGIPELGVTATSLPTQMRCRDPTRDNVSSRVFVDDPNRPERAELMCVECGTTASIDLEHRLLDAFFRASFRAMSSSSGSTRSSNSSTTADAQPQHTEWYDHG